MNYINPKPKQNYFELDIFTDGGSRGNPGPSASGYVIDDSDGNELETGGGYLGITTNNQAEYHALKLALENSLKYSPTIVNCYLDSELVVKQMRGIYKIKNRDLWPIHEEIKKFAAKIKHVRYIHVMREHNKRADQVVNEILDKYEALA